MPHKRNELTLEEYKKILVDALGFIHETCEKNRINYSLLGGSLIGAIRHKGIIPWDDDIDIVLDTKNYQKLIKALTNTKDDKYKLLTADIENTYYYPYAKLVDTSTDVEEIGCKKIHDYGAYIDIFCYHNAPKTKLGKIIHYYKIQAYKIIFSGYAHKEIKKEYKYAFLKKLGKFYAEKIGIQKIIKHYNKLISKYDNKPSNFVIFDWPVYGWKKDYQEKNNIEAVEECKFENIKSYRFSHYDDILSTTFGDYMTPPPIEKRQSGHSMRASYK